MSGLTSVDGLFRTLIGLYLIVAFAGFASASGETLGFEERVAAQRAIEQVRASHRIRPADTPVVGVAERVVRTRVEDYLAKSLVLEIVWGRTLTHEDLQVELERMTRDTRNPDRLREYFGALGDDPFLIAECLARPLLVERAIRESYAYDPNIHGALLQKIRDGESGKDLEFDLTPADGDRWIAMSARPIGVPTDVLETATYFQTETVVERSDENIRVARTRWTKDPFDSWWSDDAPERDVAVRMIPVPDGPYTLPAAPEAACTDDTWLATSTGAGVPDPRQDHTAVWTGTEMIVWGGRDPSALGTGGSYDPATDSWTPTPVGGNAPSARIYHAAVWTGAEMIVWGGFDTAYVNTGARFDPVVNSWTVVPIDAMTATPRARPTATWTGTKMIVWGGYDATGALDTGGVYEPPPGTDSWTATSINNAPTGRDAHTAVWTGTEMIVWGGYDGILDLNDGGRYDLALDSWTATAIDAATPFERQTHTAVWTGTEMIVWGGIGDFADQSGGRYDPATDSWSPTPLSGDVPSARRWHTAVWTDTELIVWGGFTGAYSTTGSRYSPITDSWTVTSTGAGVPIGRHSHTEVWIGPGDTQMIVWGGKTPAVTNTGGLYCATCPALDWHPDTDLDGFGDATLPTNSCDPIPGLLLDGSDCDDTTSAVHPGAAQVCDGLNNDCDDAGWPGLPGTNEFDNDTDGFSTCGGDCNDTDVDIWMPPGNTRDVLFGGDKQTLGWTPPLLPGSTALAYDTIRADTASTFDPAGTCVEFDDGVDTQSIDTGTPGPGAVYYYLVRAQNGCGQGPVGADSGGVPRTAVDCP